nr:polysialyltransferase family glycosyltransferase [Prochlorococcus marinus]
MKNIYVITNSSLNNTISNLLWIRRITPNNALFIILNFENYKYEELLYLKKIYEKSIIKNNFFLINVSTTLKKLFFYPALYITLLYSKLNIILLKERFFKFAVVQPRYRWLSERYKVLGQILPSFKTILIGDGLSGECLRENPPWLKSNLVNYSREREEILLGSYYIYSIYNKNKSNKISERFSKKELELALIDINNVISQEKKFIKTYFEIKKIKNKFNKIFIFCTSTFWEYDRLCIEGEINLYIKFLIKLLKKNDYNDQEDFIIFKYHPKTNPKKIKKLRKEIKAKLNINSISDGDLEKRLVELPLEILLYNLKNKNDIIVSGISTGIIGSSYLFKNINIELGFGEELVREYFLSDELVDKRLKQEALISDLIRNEPF